MSKTYRSKRECRQQMLESLPVGLRKHISLRNVEAVPTLSLPALARLAEAVTATVYIERNPQHGQIVHEIVEVSAIVERTAALLPSRTSDYS